MATAAAAIVAAARRDVLSHFMRQNAVSPQDAVAFVPERSVVRRQFERLVASGIIVEAGDGKYWLNVPAYDQWRARARKRALLAAVVLTLIVVCLWVFGR